MLANDKTLGRTALVSVLIHALVVALLPGLPQGTPRRAATRIQLTLTPRSEPERGGTLTDTPESARIPEPPPDATHLSEHSARAQNPTPDRSDGPRRPGDLETVEFRASDLLTDEAQRRARAEPSRERPPDAAAAASDERVAGSRDVEEHGSGDVPLARAATAPAAAAEAEERANPIEDGAGERRQASGRYRPRHDSPARGVSATGELSLSTYAWAWAPYLRHLRDAIDERWQPPLAFRMGLIEGDGKVRFRVLRDGTVSRITVVDSVGHPSLARAARNAVDHAGPFKPLPEDFPEPHLDVTWHYRYVILRR